MKNINQIIIISLQAKTTNNAVCSLLILLRIEMCSDNNDDDSNSRFTGIFAGIKYKNYIVQKTKKNFLVKNIFPLLNDRLHWYLHVKEKALLLYVHTEVDERCICTCKSMWKICFGVFCAAAALTTVWRFLCIFTQDTLLSCVTELITIMIRS